MTVATASLPSDNPFNNTLGESIPADTPHAVSVSLPTWRSNVGYEEGEEWVTGKMQTGYPRFFIHKSIEKLANDIIAAYGRPAEDKALLMPTNACAVRCKDFIERLHPEVEGGRIRILNLVPSPEKAASAPFDQIQPRISAVLFPKELWPAAKAFWQHTGEGVQSRRAEFCQRAFDENYLVDQASLAKAAPRVTKGPRRYQRALSTDLNGATGSNGKLSPPHTAGTPGAGVTDSAQFIEERYGRNLNTALAAQAKLAIRRRIAGSLTANIDLPDSLDEPADTERQRKNENEVPELSVDDIYIYSCGMNAIFHAHRTMLLARGQMKSIMFGFPYVDTLKVLEKFGPGALFYGQGDADDIADLERRLEAGERYLALFCEFPGNPLLKTPDLKRLRALADKYDFAIVIDETIGNFLNVHVLPHADVVVSSLTKIFSGDSNVMGGAMIVNPQRRYAPAIQKVLAVEFEDNQFEEDSVYLERNSRDFVSRIARINATAEAVADLLQASPHVKRVHYPKHSPTRPFYDACRLPRGGYGGLLSATFHSVSDATRFYDAIRTRKGPSLGTNFTLSSPFVLLAHYTELAWAAQYGCEESLVRFSIGLEDTAELLHTFEEALAAIPQDRS